jgi:DNA mismatch repair protein MutH
MNQREALSLAAKNFRSLKGKLADNLARQHGVRVSNAKDYLARVSRAVADQMSDPVKEALQGSQLKTICLEHTGTLRQDVSLPALDYVRVANERWSNSEFKRQLDSAFLFVIFQRDKDGTPRLVDAQSWKISAKDLAEAQRVWELVHANVKVNNFADLPKKRASYLCHVRPHGSSGDDVGLTPRGKSHTKKSFYLNNKFVADQLGLRREDAKRSKAD